MLFMIKTNEVQYFPIDEYIYQQLYTDKMACPDANENWSQNVSTI